MYKSNSIFERNIISIYKDIGKAWLSDLIHTVEEISATWGLSKLQPINDMSYNYVMSGLKDAQPIILKLALDAHGLKREASALKVFAGFGAVNVLAQQDGALLLERAVPGNSLKSYFPKRDLEAIQIACDVMTRLHQAPIVSQNNFPHIRDWLITLDKEWNIPAHYLKKARQQRDKLLKTSVEPVLLHGDLHHDNILQNDLTLPRLLHDQLHHISTLPKRWHSNDGWLVIDPKGVIGYPANELWAFIANPTPKLSSDIVLYRVHQFARKLNLNYQLIIDWCFVQSVLSWIWDLEDNLEPHSICLTEVFEKLSAVLNKYSQSNISVKK